MTNKGKSGRGADVVTERGQKKCDCLMDYHQLFVEIGALDKATTLIFNFMYILLRSVVLGTILL